MLRELCPKCPTMWTDVSEHQNTCQNIRHMNFARANVGTMLKYSCQAVCHMKFARSDDQMIHMFQCVCPDNMSDYMLEYLSVHN